MSHRSQPVPLLLLAGALLSCGSPLGVTPDSPGAPLTGPGPFIVSNPVPAGSAGVVADGAAGVEQVVYVSLPPGALPDGSIVRLKVERTGFETSTPLVEGGFDPVALQAAPEDTLTITVDSSAVPIFAFRVGVAARKPPMVVRVRPTNNRRDVPLNASIQVVFSEPIDAASLSSDNFRLRAGSEGVPGRLTFTNPEHTGVTFEPASELQGATEYVLVLGTGLRDTQGTALESTVSVSFVTTPSIELGSIVGSYRGTGSGYPANGNGLPADPATWWPAGSIGATPAAGYPARWITPEPGVEARSFRLDGLPAGKWTLMFSGGVAWSAVFPGLRLNKDTLVTVTVLPNQTVTIPEIVLTPVETFLMVAVERCPWGMDSPPSYRDWGDCDSGYWGGMNVAIQVRGLPGTPTEAIDRTAFVSEDRWSAEFHGLPNGEYTVHAILPQESIWRLLPWQATPVQVRLERGMAYVEFDYWFQK